MDESATATPTAVLAPADLLKGVDIHRTFWLGTAPVTVLRGVTISIPRGGIYYIMGASGAGKSTLLHIIGLLDTPSAGEVWLDARSRPDVAAGRPVVPQHLNVQTVEAQSQVRNTRFGFVFQFHHLLGEFTARENVLMPAMIGTGPVPYFMGTSGKRIRERADMLLDLVGLADRRHHRPAQLSGGERQRVAFARALMNEPDIVFCDEPTGNLDSRNAAALYELIHSLRDQSEQAFVIVTHDEHRVTRLATAPNVQSAWIHDGYIFHDHDAYWQAREATRAATAETLESEASTS